MISSLSTNDPTHGIRSKALEVIGNIHCFGRNAIQAFEQTENQFLSVVGQLGRRLSFRLQHNWSQITRSPGSQIAFAALTGKFRSPRFSANHPLDRNDLLKRLDFVQTFMVVDGDGEPYTLPSSIGGKKRMSFVFLKSIDADQLLVKIQEESSEQLPNGHRVHRIYLSDFYEEYMMNTSKKNKNLVFHFVPNEADVVVAQSIQNAKNTHSTNNSPFLGVPVFFCDSFKTGSEMHTPYFLSYEDLKYALTVSATSTINEKKAQLEQFIRSSNEEVIKLEEKAKNCECDETPEIVARLQLIQEDIQHVVEQIQKLPDLVESQLIARVDSFESILSKLEKGRSEDIKPWVLIPPNSVAPPLLEEKTTSPEGSSSISSNSSFSTRRSTS
eukprot:g7738.t1